MTYQLLIGNLPFNGKDLKELYKNIDNREFIINRVILKIIHLKIKYILLIIGSKKIKMKKKKKN